MCDTISRAEGCDHWGQFRKSQAMSRGTPQRTDKRPIVVCLFLTFSYTKGKFFTMPETNYSTETLDRIKKLERMRAL